jgi:hypothetical protein
MDQSKKAPLDVLIHLEPLEPDRPWRAVSFVPETQERCEFRSPLELLQYLERLCQELGGRVVGIR